MTCRPNSKRKAQEHHFDFLIDKQAVKTLWAKRGDMFQGSGCKSVEKPYYQQVKLSIQGDFSMKLPCYVPWTVARRQCSRAGAGFPHAGVGPSWGTVRFRQGGYGEGF